MLCQFADVVAFVSWIAMVQLQHGEVADAAVGAFGSGEIRA